MRSKQVVDTGRRKPPNAGKGRPKGSPNKLTKAAKEAFEYAFDEIGGVARLAEWADENQAEFYRLYARLIPVENRHGGPAGESLAPSGVIIVPMKDLLKETPAN